MFVIKCTLCNLISNAKNKLSVNNLYYIIKKYYC